MGKDRFPVQERSFSQDRTGLSVGIANIHPIAGNLVGNQAKMLATLDQFSARGVNLVLFPEYSLTGSFGEDKAQNLFLMEKSCLEALGSWLDELARTYIRDRLQYIVLNGVSGYKDDKFHNTTLVLDNQGVSLDPERTYHKIFLSGIEKALFRPGPCSPLVMDTDFGRLGFLTCYDISFAPLVTELVYTHKADLLIVTAAWRRQGRRDYPGLGIREQDVYQGMWETLVRALAAQNQVWVMAANCVGPHSLRELNYSGSSGIWAPSGINLIQGSDTREELLVLKNIPVQQELAKEREEFGVLKDFKLVHADQLERYL